MIPINVINPTNGDIYGQIFNDNLAPVEQVNRKLLYAIYYTQTKLLNANFNFSILTGKTALSDEQLKAIDEAATALINSVNDAVKAFDGTLTTGNTTGA